MIPDLCFRKGSDMPNQLFLTWFDNLSVKSRGEKRSCLSCKVITNHYNINEITDLLHESGIIIQPEPENFIQKGLAESRIYKHICKPSFKSPHVPAGFIYHSSDTCRNCIVRIFLKF